MHLLPKHCGRGEAKTGPVGPLRPPNLTAQSGHLGGGLTGSPLLQFLCYLSGLLPSSPLAFYVLPELFGSILPSAGWPHPPVHLSSQGLTGGDGGWVGVGWGMKLGGKVGGGTW